MIAVPQSVTEAATWFAVALAVTCFTVVCLIIIAGWHTRRRP